MESKRHREQLARLPIYSFCNVAAVRYGNQNHMSLVNVMEIEIIMKQYFVKLLKLFSNNNISLRMSNSSEYQRKIGSRLD